MGAYFQNVFELNIAEHTQASAVHDTTFGGWSGWLKSHKRNLLQCKSAFFSRILDYRND